MNTVKQNVIKEIEPCPFCGNTDIRFSVKTTTISYERAYHFAMYCPKCHCYGARVLWKYDGKMHRTAIERNEEFKNQAIDLWNRRFNNGK